MTTVSLHGLQFYAFHGFFAEEQKCGNKFVIDIDVSYPFEKAAQTDELDQTIDYTVIFSIIEKEMKTPQKLLETVAHNVISSLYSQYPSILEVDFRIKKTNPPFGGICSYSQIRIKQ